MDFKALQSSNFFTFYYFSYLSKFGDASINPPSVESIQDSINSEELPSQVNSDQTPPSIDLCVESDDQVGVGKRKLTSIVWNHYKK